MFGLFDSALQPVLADAAGGLHITGQMLLIGVLSIVAGVAGVAFLRRKNQQVAQLKLEAQDAANFLQQVGLPHSAAFWNALVRDDLVTAWKELHVILAIFKDKNQRTAALATVVDTYIYDILKSPGDPDEVARLQKLLGGTAAQAQAAPTPSGAQLAALAGLFNPQSPGPTSGQTIVHQTTPFLVQPPSLMSTVQHGLAAAAPAAAAAAPILAAAAPAAAAAGQAVAAAIQPLAAAH